MAQQSVGMTQVPSPKQSPMDAHAEALSMLANKLIDANSRLNCALDRLRGPAPQTVPQQGQNTPATPPPSGVLHVAQFGAERIRLEIEQLYGALGELEQFV